MLDTIEDDGDADAAEEEATDDEDDCDDLADLRGHIGERISS